MFMMSKVWFCVTLFYNDIVLNENTFTTVGMERMCFRLSITTQQTNKQIKKLKMMMNKKRKNTKTTVSKYPFEVLGPAYNQYTS